MTEKRTLAIGDIKPYFNNPRRIPEEAIAAVKSSLTKFGYQQPIIVDSDNVIVVGHTRHLAMKEMGVEVVDVYVTDLPEEKAREYRMVDNKVGEATSWDNNALVLELREFEAALLEEFFPSVNLEIEMLDTANAVTEEEIGAAEEASRQVKPAAEHHTTSIECPSCKESYRVRTDSLPGLSQADLQALNDAS